MTTPRVSIIIATYNRPRFLVLTLENLQEQTFRDFEIIVVDDGTPGDENETICNRFPNVVYRKIPNSGGPMQPRNTGFKMARGQYIALVDDDDLWVPGKLELQVAILDNQQQFGLVHGCCRIIDHNGELTGEITGRLSNPGLKHGQVFDNMVGNFTVMTPTAIFRRDLLNNCGMFNEKMKAAGEDMEFFSRMAFYTSFYYVDEPLALYRVHPGSISLNNPSYVNLPLELFRMLARLKKDGLSTKRSRKIRYRLLLKQVTYISNLRTLVASLKNCREMDPFFWLRPRVAYGFMLKLPGLTRGQIRK